jgi:hypothetical protein
VSSDPFAAPFVYAVGGDLHARVEQHHDPAAIDHVWITMDVGSARRVFVSVNTLSKRSRDAGFDPRVRVGILREVQRELPRRGAQACQGFDYSDVEGRANVYFEHYERTALEDLLVEKTHRAALLEVWGTPYFRRYRAGIHQIHSRRSSCAVAEDLPNRDGALRFYFASDQTCALLLFKFCGQP